MRSFSPAFRKGKNLEVRPFVVWVGVSDHIDSTRNTWDYLNRVGKVPHYLWNPSTGEVVEGISVERRATLVPSMGIQIGVICDPEDPFTRYPVNGVQHYSKGLEGLGVPWVWPSGPPSVTGTLHNVFEASLRPGHYSADQIDPDWVGLGPIDVRKIHGANAD